MRWLLLPCETRVREFDAKLLVALQAAARGVTSVVGSKKIMDLRLGSLPPGVYVAKSFTERNLLNFRLVPGVGHRLVGWDEEGLVWASREVYWRTKLDGAALAAPELLMAWGEENAAAWQAFPDYRGTPIAVTGNPRGDLLRPELAGFFAEETDAIRQRHGHFMLLNTNFSRVNHVQPAQNRHLKWLREQRPDDPRGGFAGHKFNLFNAFKQVLPKLAEAMPAGTTLVVRPHPSERQETWVEQARGFDNVVVSHQGNVVPWLLAARGLIHNGCTTAVEAYLMQRPSLAYMPVRSPEFDHPLPNGLSLQYDDAEQLIAATRECAQNPEAMFARQANSEREALLERNIAGSHGMLASERVMDTLMPLLDDGVTGRTGSIAARLGLGLRRTVRAVQSLVPGQGNHRAYLEHMFPTTSLAEVETRLARLRGCLSLDTELRVTQCAPNLFVIEPVR